MTLPGVCRGFFVQWQLIAMLFSASVSKAGMYQRKALKKTTGKKMAHIVRHFHYLTNSYFL